jgi:hypothetical protein
MAGRYKKALNQGAIGIVSTEKEGYKDSKS